MSKHIVVSLEHRFYSCGSRLYTKLAFPYAYWEEYLACFDVVEIVARVQAVNEVDCDMQRVDGPRVVFTALPYYVGIKAFFFALAPLVAALLGVAIRGKAFLLRSGNVSNLLWIFLVVLRKPYLREYPGNVMEGIVGVVGDTLIVRVLARFLDVFARVQGRFSKANSFVSEYCRDLYGSKRPSYVFSSFRVGEIREVKAFDAASSGIFRIVAVGRLEGEKGHRDLIAAVGLVAGCRLDLVGDGRMRAALGAMDHAVKVNFHGAVTNREKLFDLLRASDLFVIPSLTEGMPRALLEAMAIGLPCIGSRVGGIPEVLPEECLFEPGRPDQMAEMITRLESHLQTREAMGMRNLRFVKDHFSEQLVRQRKHAFWNCVYE